MQNPIVVNPQQLEQLGPADSAFFPQNQQGLTAQRRQTAEISCPKAMVGRVIGKNGETIKALQTYTGALIQIDQSTEPTRVTVSGNFQALSLAVNMISDICKGTFKGFALLRQMVQQQRSVGPYGPAAMQPRPVYAPGYGLIPPSQLYNNEDRLNPGLAFNRPDGLQLQPTYSYLSTGTAPASVTPSQVILGLPNTGVPQRSMLVQAGGTGTLQLAGGVQQQPLGMQTVYTQVPAPGGGYTTQLAYYPAQEFAAAVGGAEGLTYTTTAQPQLQAQAGGLDTGYGLVMGGAGNQYSVKPAGGPGVGGMVGGYLQQPLGGAGNMAGLQGLAAAEALRNNNSGVNRGVGLGGSGGMMGLGGAGGSGTRLTAGAGLRGPTSGTVVVSMNNTLGGSGLAGLGSSTGVGPSGPTSSAFGGPTSGAGVTGLGSVSSPGSGTAVGGLLVSPAAQAALDSAGLTMGASAVNTLLGATDAATGGPGSNANVGNSGGLVMVGSTGGAGAGGAGGPDGSSTQVVQVVDAEGQITYHYLQ